MTKEEEVRKIRIPFLFLYQLVCICNGCEEIGKNKVENFWDKLVVYVSVYEEYYPTIFEWGGCLTLNF